jgi:lipopolysaccharide/colanic/teichoic acid biosynthesis glycosyltransferase
LFFSSAPRRRALLRLKASGTQDLIVKINQVRVKSGNFLAFLLDHLAAFVAYMMFAAIVFYILVAKISERNGEFFFADQAYGSVHVYHLFTNP